MPVDIQITGLGNEREDAVVDYRLPTWTGPEVGLFRLDFEAVADHVPSS